MDLACLVTALSKDPALRFLLIGGHAVIAHGYPRTTFDIDLLVEKTKLAMWIDRLRSLGYGLARQEGAFAQLTPPPGDLELDLMLVGDETFEGLWQSAGTVVIEGQSARIPSLDHLLALKFHVLKQNLRHRAVKDLDDVIRLVLANQLNIQSDHYRRLFEKYGTSQDYERVLRATQP